MIYAIILIYVVVSWWYVFKHIRDEPVQGDTRLSVPDITFRVDGKGDGFTTSDFDVFMNMVNNRIPVRYVSEQNRSKTSERV